VGACSLREPGVHEEQTPTEQYLFPLPLGGPEKPPPSPATVYFIHAGKCRISASGGGEENYQKFSVVPDPSLKITFTSLIPSHARVGEGYAANVRAEGVQVWFFITTPAVCGIEKGRYDYFDGRFHGLGEVYFLEPGTCTVGVRQVGEGGIPESYLPEAEQSFVVFEPEPATTTPAGAGVAEREANKPPSEVAKSAPKVRGSRARAMKLKKALHACAKDKAKRKRERCRAIARRKYGTANTPNGAITTETPQALSATVIVHVNVVAPACREPGGPDETAPIRITRLPGSGVIHSIETSEHTVHLVPGNYEIRATIPNAGGTPGPPQDVLLSSGQTQEVTLEIRRYASCPVTLMGLLVQRSSQSGCLSRPRPRVGAAMRCSARGPLSRKAVAWAVALGWCLMRRGSRAHASGGDSEARSRLWRSD
jgi:hypothetical protein